MHGSDRGEVQRAPARGRVDWKAIVVLSSVAAALGIAAGGPRLAALLPKSPEHTYWFGSAHALVPLCLVFLLRGAVVRNWPSVRKFMWGLVALDALLAFLFLLFLVFALSRGRAPLAFALVLLTVALSARLVAFRALIAYFDGLYRPT